VVAVFLTFVVTVLFMFVLRPLAFAVGLVDLPGGRKRHGVPVPVIGGIAMSIGLGFGTTLVSQPESWSPILLGVYLLAVVGTIDDRFDLPANVRLIAQSCAALLVIFASGVAVLELGEFFGYTLSLGGLTVPFTILFVLTLVNAFNLTDGIDGLGGGLALLSLLAMGALCLGTPAFALVTVAASVVAGYLLFNLPLGVNSAVRSFMGDAGSTALGLIIATMGIYLTQGEMRVVAPAVGLWLVAVPIFEFFTTIVRRLLSHRSPFTPDHEHLHHVLAEHGLSRRATLVLILGLAALCAAVGILGHISGVADSIMVALWLVAGTAYYQLLRYPRAAVAAALWLQRPDTVEFGRDLGSERGSTSKT
jgi:UDP-GlcNAc:undecaprenyl-phosphate/decaprenyl-phosphate GlcNAc-1-phosphate transferase